MRFPGFEGEEHRPYKNYFFKDIFLFSTGKNIKQDQASPEFEIPCVRYGELYYMYNEVINEVINRTNLDTSELLFSQGNEILLPSAGEDPLDIGLASALAIENVAIGRTINILRPMRVNVYSHIYVSYYINQKLRKKISTLAKGSSISNVYNSDLKTLEIILPNIDEQTKIASFLSLIDLRIQTQSKTIEDLETLMKGVSEKLFSQKLRFKQFADDWEVRSGNDIFANISDKNHNSDLPILAITQDRGAIPRDLIDYNITVTEKSVDSYKVVQKGDFIISLRSFQGGIEYSEYHGICSPAYIVLRTIMPISKTFYKYYLKADEYIVKLNKRLEGIRDGKMISYKYFSEIPLPFPSLKEQTKIASCLSLIAQKIETEKEILEQLEMQKKYLLQQMFV